MTTPEPDDDFSYPESGRPRERVQLDRAASVEPLEIELHLAALPPQELQLMLARIEAMRR